MEGSQQDEIMITLFDFEIRKDHGFLQAIIAFLEVHVGSQRTTEIFPSYSPSFASFIQSLVSPGLNLDCSYLQY